MSDGTDPNDVGDATDTTDVENYLDFPEGAGGMELIQRGKEQPERFGAGDVVDSAYRQTVTAAGTGSVAAFDAENWLDNESASTAVALAEPSASD
nr:hypothetical protein [Natrarchaeobius halalkaliphilus]